MLNSTLNHLFPDTVHQLTEQSSINLIANMQQKAIATPLSSTPIPTTFICQGDGNIPILLIHGFDSSILEFRRILPLLALKHQTFAVDLLGFGFTERLPKLNINPENIKTHLYAFWQSLINQPIILIGVSMGGAVAIDFTLTYPEIVHKLILIDSAGLTNKAKFNKHLIKPLGYVATNFLRNEFVRSSISKSAYFDQAFLTLDAKICVSLHLDQRNWHEALISFTESGGYGNFALELANIQQQTLILWGENDKILGIKDPHKFNEFIPNSQLIWIKECGHVPHLEKAKITTEYILQFIENS
ncbi:MAG TPA: alpha/beta hydrolase [Allocoleopsis sp.]